MRTSRLGFAMATSVAGLLGLGADRLGAQPPPSCLPGTDQYFSATGDLQTYDAPPDAAVIRVDAVAGSGGDEGIGDYEGGFGARLVAEVPVTGGETLHVIVGEAGEGGATGPGNAGGGGGGSAVYRGASTALVVAGGGGGAGITDDGDDGQLGANGSAGGGANGGAGGVAGQGGGASTVIEDPNAGGGGGFASAGGTSAEAGSGGGGHRLPGDAAGGAAGEAGDGAGGFGGGGGAGGPGGGGGGGYSGGGGGWGEGVDGGGGGGSFVHASGTTISSGVVGASGDGSVLICVTQTGVPAVPRGGLVLLGALLATAAALSLRRLA